MIKLVQVSNINNKHAACKKAETGLHPTSVDHSPFLSFAEPLHVLPHDLSLRWS